MVQLIAIAAQDSGGSPLAGLAIPVLLLGVFYFLLIRPQQRRAKAQQALVQSVEEGDEIVMTSGIIGTIVDIDEQDDTLIVEIAPNTRIRILRAGVGRRMVDDTLDVDDDDDVYDDEDADDATGDDDSDEHRGPIQQL